jgi:hypothetical protein
MTDDDTDAIVKHAEHIAEAHRLEKLGLLLIDGRQGVTVRNPSDPRVIAWLAADDTLGPPSDRAWLLFEVGRLVAEASELRQPASVRARIMDFGTRIPEMGDAEVVGVLDALAEARTTLH